MSPDLMQIQARINKAAADSTNPSSSFYRDQSEELERIDLLIQRVAPSLKKEWDSFQSDLSLAILLDKEIRKADSTNNLESLEGLDVSLQSGIQRIKKTWGDVQQEKPLSLKEWVAFRKKVFLKQIASSQQSPSLSQRTESSFLSTIRSFASFLNVAHFTRSLIGRVFLVSTPLVLDPLLRLFRGVLSPSASLENTAQEIDDDEEAFRLSGSSFQEERARALEQEKRLISENKRNLHRVICSLAMSITRGDYGENLKEAFLSSDPSVIARSSFLKFLLIEGARKSNPPLHLLELKIPEVSIETIKAVTRALQDRPFTAQELEHLFLGYETVSLSPEKQEIAQRLNGAIQEISSTREEEQVHGLFLHQTLEIMKKGADLYEGSFRFVGTLSSPLERASFLMRQMNLIGEAHSDLFLESAERVLKEIKQGVEPSEQESLKKELLEIVLKNREEALSFSLQSEIGKFLLEEEEKALDPLRKNSLIYLLLPSLGEENPSLALDKIKEIVSFASSHEESEVRLFLFTMLLDWSPRNKEVEELALQVAHQLPLESRYDAFLEMAQKTQEEHPEIAKQAAFGAFISAFPQNMENEEAVKTFSQKIEVLKPFPITEEVNLFVQERLAKTRNNREKMGILSIMILFFSSIDRGAALMFARQGLEIFNPGLHPGFTQILENASKIRNKGVLTRNPLEIDEEFQELFLEAFQRKVDKDPLQFFFPILNVEEISKSGQFEEFGQLPIRLAQIALAGVDRILSNGFKNLRTAELDSIIRYLRLIDTPEITDETVKRRIKESIFTIELEQLKKISDPIQKIRQYQVLIELLLNRREEKAKALELGRACTAVLQEIEYPDIRFALSLDVFILFFKLNDPDSLRFCLDVIDSEPDINLRFRYFFLLAEHRPDRREQLLKQGLDELKKLPPLEQKRELNQAKNNAKSPDFIDLIEKLMSYPE